MDAFCLTLHAGYRCRHSGDCCRTWTVPAEPHVLTIVEARAIRPTSIGAARFVRRRRPAGAAEWDVARDSGGRCVFFDEDRGRLCRIHEAAGPSALPSACRHFPRVVLQDDRGTFVSLSHFCPTAAEMLLDAAPPAIVRAPASLGPEDPVEGMAAIGALPPLVRPGLLSDLEGYAAWERAGIATFARPDLTWTEALDHIAAATERVRQWRPAEGPLAEHVDRAFAVDPAPPAASDGGYARAMGTLRAIVADGAREALAPIDGFEEHWRRRCAPVFAAFDRPMKHFLAARLFAAWVAYQGRGLRSVVEWLRTAAALVRHHAVRQAVEAGTPGTPRDWLQAVRLADLLLLHSLDTRAFARQVAALEGPDPR